MIFPTYVDKSHVKHKYYNSKKEKKRTQRIFKNVFYVWYRYFLKVSGVKDTRIQNKARIIYKINTE